MLYESWAVASLVTVLCGRGTSPADCAGMEAQPERTWTKIMYFGGAPGVRGVSTSWDNRLQVSPTKIRVNLKNGQVFEVDTSRVTSLTYVSPKRTNDGAAAVGFIAAGLLGGLILSGIKSTDHYLVIEYLLADDRPGGVLLRLHKDSCDEILNALETATHSEVITVDPGQAK